MDSGVCGCEKASCLRSDPDPYSSQSQMVLKLLALLTAENVSDILIAEGMGSILICLLIQLEAAKGKRVSWYGGTRISLRWATKHHGAAAPVIF